MSREVLEHQIFKAPKYAVGRTVYLRSSPAVRMKVTAVTLVKGTGYLYDIEIAKQEIQGVMAGSLSGTQWMQG